MSPTEQPRVVMVVGASSGIGLATARRLAAAGDRVVLVSRSEQALKAAAADLAGDPLVVTADVLDAGSLTAAVERTVAAYGRLDAVVTTAQVMAYGTIEQVPAEVFRAMVDTAQVGTVNLATAVLPVFRRQGGGSLVVVNSLLAQIAVPSMGAYCAAKWGQLGLVRALQLETRHERGIHVSIVSPGAIDTPIYAQAATYAGRAGHAPPPVIGPDRVARAIVGCLDRPRRLVHVPLSNRVVVLGYTWLPFLFDRLAPLLVRWVVLRGPRVPDTAGSVFTPVPVGEAERGGWSLLGRRRRRTGGD